VIAANVAPSAWNRFVIVPPQIVTKEGLEGIAALDSRLGVADALVA
jgi:hypothetical protein